MKVNRKSTRVAYWVLRVLAISSALLLFSVTGIVALQTTTRATAFAASSNTTTSGTTLSPADNPTNPPSTPTLLPTNTPSPDPTATSAPPPTQVPPTQVPTKVPTKPPVVGSTPTPTPIIPVGVTPTSTAVLGGAPPPPAAKGTSKAKPSPTPSGSPTPGPSNTQVPAIPDGNTPTTPKNQASSGGFTAMIKPLIWPIAGVSATILLSSAGLLGLMLWKKRTAGQGAAPQPQSSPAQATAPWMNEQVAASNGYFAQPTEATIAQNQTMIPFAMQSIVQYSPLLGAPDSSHLDAPVPPPTSDFRPLPLDYPQILEVHTDKMPALVSSTQQAPSATADAEFQPALQFASTPLSPTLDALDAGSPSTPAQTPIPPTPQVAPTAYQFPQHDSSLENLMHQAQMGIFALPGKEA